ncbi:MAG TPA: GNAT family protein [Candidatus Paceibacterota bacterium]|jgi:hypothetical protein
MTVSADFGVRVTTPIVTYGKWAVREMVLSWEKIDIFWEQLNKHKTIFSDITRGDKDNYMRALTAPNSLWLEFWDEETHEIIGLAWVAEMEMVIDAVLHMVFFDRMAAEKLPLYKLLLKWLFDSYPLHRVSVTPPAMYGATCRLLERIGFKREGTKREAMLIGNRWNDVRIYGITRHEVEALQ